MERTISGMVGKGSVNHNTRAFTAKNVDSDRSCDNVHFCNEDIKQIYHKLFDEALERYNAKQKRKDRMIDDYYEKIRQGKQEKLFHEVIFQIGNKDDMNARSEEGLLAKKILTEFMEEFQKQNPNLYVFSAYLHMDEETPHLHIDFVPYITGSKRGLDTRVSLKSALAAEGFTGGTRGATEWNQWITAEKQALAKVMERYGVNWLQKGTHEKHLSVLDFEKKERAKEVAELDSQKQEKSLEIAELDETVSTLKQELMVTESKQVKVEAAVKKAIDEGVAIQKDNERLVQKQATLQSDNRVLEQTHDKLQQDNSQLEEQQEKLKSSIEQMVNSEKMLQRDVRKYDEEPEWQLPEPGAFASAKSFRDKSAFPLVNKLKELVKKLTIQCVRLKEEVLQLRGKIESLTRDVEFYKGKVRDISNKAELLQEKVDDLERVKRYAGAEQIDTIISKVKDQERREQQLRQYNRSNVTR
ncbi:plasmid recombination protein [Prevotella sp.]|uniref:plasmid recombination protein n=1 Tax=Prevotella sp. TaxID=59823 RepID=UPI003FD79CE4